MLLLIGPSLKYPGWDVQDKMSMVEVCYVCGSMENFNH